MADSSNVEHFTYAIIGGGIAGVTCAEHLEILDGERSVVLVSGSDLIKSVTNVLHLTKSIDIFKVKDTHHSYLRQLCPSVTVKPSAVTKLDTENRKLHLHSGELIQYEKLCICTGAVPKVLFEGHPHVLYIRDTDSVKTFQQRISKAKRILIVGNGGIATEMVYEITGVEVVWAVKDSWFTAAFIDPGAAEFFRPQLTREKTAADEASNITKRKKYTVDQLQVTEQSGDSSRPLGGALGPDWHDGLTLTGAASRDQLRQRRVCLETEVEIVSLHTPEEVEASEELQKRLAGEDTPQEVPTDTPAAVSRQWAVYVELTNGKVYGCDFVVSATGVTPNTNILQGGQFDFSPDGGVSVAEDMQTSVPGVYAAGDVCTPSWPWPDHWQQMRLWTQARQMGSYASKCMWAAVTGQEIYQDFCFELFTHATKFFGHKVVMLGLYNGQKLDGKYEILLRLTRGVEYIKVILKDGKMQGALLVGETDLEETFENLILNQMDLSSYGEDLLDPDVDIEDYFD